MEVLRKQTGFTILEVVIAIVILTVGLMGVAGMQTKAVQGNSFAYGFNEGSNTAQEWMEWINVYVNSSNQENILYNGKLQKENFVTISEIDTNSSDDIPTTIQIPHSASEIIETLTDNGFTNPQGANFTASQIPGSPKSGCAMTWNITANKPIQNVTTVEIQTTTNNAFARNKRNIIRFMVSTNM